MTHQHTSTFSRPFSPTLSSANTVSWSAGVFAPARKQPFLFQELIFVSYLLVLHMPTHSIVVHVYLTPCVCVFKVMSYLNTNPRMEPAFWHVGDFSHLSSAVLPPPWSFQVRQTASLPQQERMSLRPMQPPFPFLVIVCV